MLNNIFVIILAISAVSAGYAGFVYCVKSRHKNFTTRQSRNYVNREATELFTSAPVNLPLGSQEKAEIIETVSQFSVISKRNARSQTCLYEKIPYVRLEIMDSDFPSHWQILRANLERTFERMFAYNGVDGLVLVTYEKTVQDNIYHIVIFWANAYSSKKALRKKCQSMENYDRKMEMEKNAPFVDRELDDEIHRMDDSKHDK